MVFCADLIFSENSFHQQALIIGPARSKGCKYNQHNGKFGCLKCLHPTIYTTKTIYPCLKTVNEWIIARNHEKGTKRAQVDEIYVRTKAIYEEQVNKVLSDPKRAVFEGVQG